jgi:hypothetical protein
MDPIVLLLVCLVSLATLLYGHSKKALGFVIFGSLSLMVSGALVSVTYPENTLLVLWGSIQAIMGALALFELVKG